MDSLIGTLITIGVIVGILGAIFGGERQGIVKIDGLK